MSLPFFGGRRGLYVPQGNPYAGQTLVVYASGTFSRSSSGTYLTSATTVAEASTNVLRLEDRGDGNGAVALFEGARTTYANYSSSLGSWISIANNTGTTNYATSPLGTTTAGRVLKTGAASNCPLGQALTLTIGQRIVVSFWLKGTATSGESFRCGYGNTTYALAAAFVKSVTPAAWTFYSAAATVQGAVENRWNFEGRLNYPNTGDPSLTSGLDALFWGGQIEVDTAFPSSHVINNSGSSATRSADTLSLTTAQYNTAALLSLPWAFDAYPYFATSDLIDGDEFWLFSFGGATSGIRIRRASGNTRVEVLDGGSVVVSSDPLTFSRHQKLTVTVRPAAGSVTVAGATSGNGTVVGTAWAFDSATLRVGGILSGTGEAFCRISQPVGVT